MAKVDGPCNSIIIESGVTLVYWLTLLLLLLPHTLRFDDHRDSCRRVGIPPIIRAQRASGKW